MKHTEFNWQSRRGDTIYAQDWRPEGRVQGVVVLVHGLGEHSGRYGHVAECFNQAGYGLIAFDLPGHGRSTGKRGYTSFEEVAGELQKLLQQVPRRYPDLPVFLYGHSLGGALSLYYLLTRKPDLRGAIVTGPGLAPGEPVSTPKLVAVNVMARLYPAFAIENGLNFDSLTRDSEVKNAYQNDPLVHSKISALLAMNGLVKGPWVIKHAGELSVPLLLMQGGADRVVVPAATQAFAQAATPGMVTFKIWDELCHELHNEPEKVQVLQTMITFLDSLQA